MGTFQTHTQFGTLKIHIKIRERANEVSSLQSYFLQIGFQPNKHNKIYCKSLLKVP